MLLVPITADKPVCCSKVMSVCLGGGLFAHRNKSAYYMNKPDRPRIHEIYFTSRKHKERGDHFMLF